MLTMGNSGYLDFMLNWAASLDRVGVRNYIAVALDTVAYEGLAAASVNVHFDVALTGNTTSGTPRFKSEEYINIVTLKPRLISFLLHAGLNVLWCDGDIVLFVNPWDEIHDAARHRRTRGHGDDIAERAASEPAHIVTQTDSHWNYTMRHIRRFANSGFTYYRHSPLILTFAKCMLGFFGLPEGVGQMDQDALNWCIHFWNQVALILSYVGHATPQLF